MVYFKTLFYTNNFYDQIHTWVIQLTIGAKTAVSFQKTEVATDWVIRRGNDAAFEVVLMDS